MSAELDQLAEYFENQGFSEVAQKTEEAARLARAVGAPVHYRETKQLDENSPTMYIPHDKLIAVLRNFKTSQGRPILTDELAQQINEAFGANLHNSTQVRTLHLPEARPRIDPLLTQRYTYVINAATGNLIRKFGSNELGMLRMLDLEEFSRFEHLGENSARFLHISFKPAETSS